MKPLDRSKRRISSGHTESPRERLLEDVRSLRCTVSDAFRLDVPQLLTRTDIETLLGRVGENIAFVLISRSMDESILSKSFTVRALQLENSGTRCRFKVSWLHLFTFNMALTLNELSYSTNILAYSPTSQYVSDKQLLDGDTTVESE